MRRLAPRRGNRFFGSACRHSLRMTGIWEEVRLRGDIKCKMENIEAGQQTILDIVLAVQL